MNKLYLISGVAAVLFAQPMVAAPVVTDTAASGLQATEDYLVVAQNQNSNQNQNNNQSNTQSNNQNQNQNQNSNSTPDAPDVPDALAPAASAKAQAQAAHVCFYDLAEFKGDKYCAASGGLAKSLPQAWNDRVSSIEIVGNIGAKVCTDPGLVGECAAVNKSAASLDASFDDKISSWEVK